MRQWRLIVLLGCEVAILTALAGVGDLRRHVPLFILLFVGAALLYLPAALTAMQMRLSFAAVLVIALQLRVPMFFTEPTLSDDVWRYIHDGRAQAAGVNPYLYAPNDPRTAQYRGPEFSQINHPELPTIYPPVAQLAFRLAAATIDPLFVWRLLVLAAEVAILIAGALLLKRHGLPAANLALYAWHPLAIVEGVGSAHVEPVAVAFLVVACWGLASAANARAGAALAASVAAKLVALPLLVLGLRSGRAAMAFTLVLLAAYLPFSFDNANAFGSLRIFTETWESNASIYSIVAPWLGPRDYRVWAAVILVGVVALLYARRTSLNDAAFLFFLAFFLLSPVVHPWYLLWVLAFLSLRRSPLDAVGRAALVWTISIVLSYSAQQQFQMSGLWRIPQHMLLAEYVPVYLLLIMAATALPFSQMKLTAITRKNAAKM